MVRIFFCITIFVYDSQDKFLETDLRFLIFTDSVLFSKMVMGHYKLFPSPYKRSLYTLLLPTLGVNEGNKVFSIGINYCRKRKGDGGVISLFSFRSWETGIYFQELIIALFILFVWILIYISHFSFSIRELVFFTDL